MGMAVPRPPDLGAMERNVGQAIQPSRLQRQQARLDRRAMRRGIPRRLKPGRVTGNV